MTGSGQPAGDEIRADISHPARVYDYLLGGKDNFAADREAAEWVLRVVPEMLDAARESRHFLVRAVRFMSHLGIRRRSAGLTPPGHHFKIIPNGPVVTPPGRAGRRGCGRSR